MREISDCHICEGYFLRTHVHLPSILEIQDPETIVKLDEILEKIGEWTAIHVSWYHIVLFWEVTSHARLQLNIWGPLKGQWSLSWTPRNQYDDISPLHSMGSLDVDYWKETGWPSVLTEKHK